MIYADASALVKRAVDEPESAALREWLSTHAGGEVIVATNRIGAVEVVRAAARVSEQARAAATAIVDTLALMEITRTAYAVAATLRPPSVRTLDALHVASAAEIPRLAAFLTYDARMAEAATHFGLPVVSPV